MYRLLIIEDEKGIAESIADNLSNYGFETRTIDDFSRTMEIFKDFDPHMVLLDIKLPYYDGYHYCAEIRKISKLPIIFISSASDNMNIIMAMNMGGDDFITKPFGTDELLARIRTALRHIHVSNGDTANSGIFRSGDLVVDFEKHRIQVGGVDVHLTQNEFRIVALLAQNAGKVMTYDNILRELWGPYAKSDNQILRVNMANIRRKLEKNPAEPKYIFTEVGVGYRMTDNEV